MQESLNQIPNNPELLSDNRTQTIDFSTTIKRSAHDDQSSNIHRFYTQQPAINDRFYTQQPSINDRFYTQQPSINDRFYIKQRS